jgi:hypothetical protein
MWPDIGNPACYFFWLVRACTSLYKLYRAKNLKKLWKSTSNLRFTESGVRQCREKAFKCKKPIKSRTSAKSEQVLYITNFFGMENKVHWVQKMMYLSTRSVCKPGLMGYYSWARLPVPRPVSTYQHVQIAPLHQRHHGAQEVHSTNRRPCRNSYCIAD